MREITIAGLIILHVFAVLGVMLTLFIIVYVIACVHDLLTADKVAKGKYEESKCPYERPSFDERHNDCEDIINDMYLKGARRFDDSGLTEHDDVSLDFYSDEDYYEKH